MGVKKGRGRIMDFFEYAELVQIFTNNETLWVSYLVGGLCFAVVFIFSAVALYTIAVREGYRHKWMACIPFFNTYYIGVCGQKNRCLNLDAKKVSMVTAIIEAILVVGYTVYYIGNSLLASGGYMILVEETGYGGLNILSYSLTSNVPASLSWAEWCFNYLDTYILWWLQLVYLFLDIMVLACFFQTFAARRYFLFTITSVLFPIQGILFFVLRNNTGMNYRDFMRREQERQYRMYQQYNRQQYNPYNNPYNGNPYDNPYNQNPYSQGGYRSDPSQGTQGGTSNADDPFAEYGGGSGNSGSSGGSGNDPFDLN